MREETYLTDKELELLILQVEEQELVTAPPGMLEAVLGRVDAETDFKQKVCEAEVKDSEQKVCEAEVKDSEQKVCEAEVKDSEQKVCEAEEEDFEQVSDKWMNIPLMRSCDMEAEKELHKQLLQEKQASQGKIIEFRRYCIRVTASVAAAIAIIFLTPDAEYIEKPERLVRQDFETEVFTREEALQENNLWVRILENSEILEEEVGGSIYETEKEE